MSNEKQTLAADAERRRFPRVAITVPVMLTRSDQRAVTGLMHNVSPGGMQVHLGAESAATLLPENGEIGTGEDFSIHARFLVPLRQERVAISVECAVAHVSPAEARVAVGFRFKRFEDTKSLRRFVLFIEERLVPVEDYELYLHGPGRSRGKPSSKTTTTP